MAEGGPVVCGLDFKERSAAINSDPKMKELKHYERSHQHENRLRQSAELEKRVPCVLNRRALRSQGCADMDDAMKALGKEEAVVPYIAKTGELPDAFREKPGRQGDLKDSMETRLAMLRRMDRFQTRLTWRDSMDHSLKRLMVDMDLSRDERIKEFEVKSAAKMEDPSANTDTKVKEMRFARARCQHLDNIYDWYLTHGQKEARKERKAPPYLTYNSQHPVMPGSMRVPPPMRDFSKGMGQSSSSPALLAAGAATMPLPAVVAEAEPPPAPAEA
jgi:hypothetical protein